MREEREAAQVERRAREDDMEKRNFEAVTSFMVESNKTIQDLNVQQLKALVKWFKRPGDSKMPSKKQELIQRYEQTKGRVQTEHQRKKDNEEAVRDGDEENAVPDAEGDGAAAAVEVRYVSAAATEVPYVTAATAEVAVAAAFANAHVAAATAEVAHVTVAAAEIAHVATAAAEVARDGTATEV
jgi:hypothetical protein